MKADLFAPLKNDLCIALSALHHPPHPPTHTYTQSIVFRKPSLCPFPLALPLSLARSPLELLHVVPGLHGLSALGMSGITDLCATGPLPPLSR